MVHYISENDTITLMLKGRLDTLSGQALEQEINEIITDQYSKVYLNMKEVEYISSTFMRLCLKLVKQFGKENFSLQQVSPTVFLVLKVAGLSELCSDKQ